MFFINLKSPILVHLSLLFSLCAILFFSHLGAFPFFNKGEPREAIVVQDIVHHGNWLFPKRMGSGIPSKPPLFHWVGALISIIHGRVTEVTTRFPSALFATLGILLLYGLGRRIYNPAVGLLAGVILATSLDYSRLAIVARVDMTLTFFLSLGLALFYLLYSDQLKGTLWTYLFYLVLGIGVLAKGPVSLILIGMTIVIFLGVRRRWDYLVRLCLHWGALLTVGIPLFWYGMAMVQGGEEFIGRQIIHENLARFFSYGEIGTGHQKPVYYYFLYLFLGGLPWTLLLPFVVAELFRGKRFSEEGTVFMVVWAVVVFTFFSLSGGEEAALHYAVISPCLAFNCGLDCEVSNHGQVGNIGLTLFNCDLSPGCLDFRSVDSESGLGRRTDVAPFYGGTATKAQGSGQPLDRQGRSGASRMALRSLSVSFLVAVALSRSKSLEFTDTILALEFSGDCYPFRAAGAKYSAPCTSGG